MPRLRLDEAVCAAIDALRDTADWLDGMSRDSAEHYDVMAAGEVAGNLRRAAADLEQSWSD